MDAFKAEPVATKEVEVVKHVESAQVEIAIASVISREQTNIGWETTKFCAANVLEDFCA
jgi:hypothetical protein